MQTAILHSIRHHAQVKGSLRFTALEIAYRFNSSGIARIAYSYLAKRTGFHVRTIIRHVARLVDLGIIAKTVTRLNRTRYARNLYTYCGPAENLHKRSTDNFLSARRTGEKNLPRARENLDPPVLTEAGKRWYTSYRRLFGLPVQE